MTRRCSTTAIDRETVDQTISVTDNTVPDTVSPDLLQAVCVWKEKVVVHLAHSAILGTQRARADVTCTCK